MKTSDIRKMSADEINSKIAEIKNELFELRMKQATGTLERRSKIKNCIK